MKKILIGLVALVFIIGGSAFAWYKINYGGTNYYVQIHNDGKKLEEKRKAVLFGMAMVIKKKPTTMQDKKKH